MTNLTINTKNHTIEMSKGFAKNAAIYGTEEYNNLQNVRRDYPTFRIVTKAPSKRNDPFKGLTLDYMEKYIEAHDDDAKSIMADFNALRGKVDENEENHEYAEAASFFEIKKWFLTKYHEIKKYSEASRKMISAILGKAA